MIKEIALAGLPCFDVQATLADLSTINYVFGPNGSGKTTISQGLARLGADSRTAVKWWHQERTIKVYNRNYVREAFTNADGEERGVFLLGEDSRETFDKIKALEAEKNKTAGKIEGHQNMVDRLEAELESKRSRLSEAVWARRVDIPVLLKEHMSGINGSKKRCLENVLKSAKAHVQRGEDTLDTLAKKAETAFDITAKEESLFPAPPCLAWNETSLEAVLEAPIVGSADLPLADLIGVLGNSDWVHEGLSFLESKENSEGLCPFCQQEAPHGLAEKIASIFDETFEKKRDEIVAFHSTVGRVMAALRLYRSEYGSELESAIGVAEARKIFHALELSVDGVEKTIQQKLLKPSASIALPSVKGDYSAFEELIAQANESIAATNAIVANRRGQRDLIIKSAWREFARGQLSDLLDVFAKEETEAQRSIDGIKASIEKKNEYLMQFEAELRELRGKTASSGGSIQAINDLLALSQFYSFKLTAATTKKDGYRIIREDGQAVDVETLSEGERTFITFLYFYHSLSEVKQDGETDKILAVIDDPISSLDGDIMFVVSALTRRIIQTVRSQAHDRVEQILLLTHNTRFHNEVCYIHKGQEAPAVKFYRIRKYSPDPSRIEDCGKRNPIRTAYQELWDEVATAESSPPKQMPWLPNVLRRILESYFTTLGGIGNLYKIGDQLQPTERALHDALIAWSHSGSHTIMDAEMYAQNSTSNARWLEAFARIFRSTSDGAHLGHYRMMMDEAKKYVI